MKQSPTKPRSRHQLSKNAGALVGRKWLLVRLDPDGASCTRVNALNETGFRCGLELFQLVVALMYVVYSDAHEQ